MKNVKASVPYPKIRSPYEVTSDVAGFKTLFVNVFFIGRPGPGNHWVLVDAGLPGYASYIRAKAEQLFGQGTQPDAILLTHGHIDHVGSLAALLNHWKVPVYAHALELPYLQGKASYPPPDPLIGGGFFSYISWLYPIGPSNFGDQIQPIPSHGMLAELPDWHIIHTPGHSPGHVSFFRYKDRTLLAGDALLTTNQNSLRSVVQQREEMHGPPAYFTCNWRLAKESLHLLASLHPQALGSGHGVPVQGLDLPRRLYSLLGNFEPTSIPSSLGRYVKQPAQTSKAGIVSMPWPASYYLPRWIGLMALTLGAFYLLYSCFSS